MAEYNARLGRANERWFTGYDQAEAWLEAL
jgi:hypothetical protein